MRIPQKFMKNRLLMQWWAITVLEPGYTNVTSSFEFTLYKYNR